MKQTNSQKTIETNSGKPVADRASFKFIALALAASVLAGGCATTVESEYPKDASVDLETFLDLCYQSAKDEKPYDNAGEDWPVKAGFLKCDRQATYRVVYADATNLSFRADESGYDGGAHGWRKVTVGTINRSTGKLLKADDLVPEGKRTEVLAALRDKVVEKIGGKGNLLSDVFITDNCFVTQDGIHFVFNEYEVACYAAGVIEVVLPRY